MSEFIVVLALLAAAQSPLDRTVPSAQVAGVLIDAKAGRIDVRAVARSDIRVKGSVPFTIEPDGKGLRIRPADARAVQEVAFDIEVPRAMAVRAIGSFTDVTISEVGGEVRVDTREGAVQISGGTGVTTVHSINGGVSVKGRAGDVTVMAAESAVTVSNTSGAITVEGTSGSVTLEGIRSTAVDVQTVSGEIAFSGPVAGNGRYAFMSHTGGITLTPSAGGGAMLTLFTARGSLEGSPALVPISVESGKLTKRVYRVGSGGGEIVVRTLSGRIVLNWNGK